MKIEFYQSTDPLPRFVVHAENELEEIIFRLFLRDGRDLALGGSTYRDGKCVSFNFGLKDPV